MPVGIAASSELLSRALGSAYCPQRDDKDEGALRHQFSSGHVEVARLVVSRPRNHFTCANGVPTLTEKSPRDVDWMREVHQ